MLQISNHEAELACYKQESELLKIIEFFIENGTCIDGR